MDTLGNKGAHTEIQAIKIAVPAMAEWVIDKAIQGYGGAGVSQDAVGPVVGTRPHPAPGRWPRRSAHRSDRQIGTWEGGKALSEVSAELISSCAICLHGGRVLSPLNDPARVHARGQRCQRVVDAVEAVTSGDQFAEF